MDTAKKIVIFLSEFDFQTQQIQDIYDERVTFLLRKTLQKQKSILKDVMTFRNQVKAFV